MTDNEMPAKHQNSVPVAPSRAQGSRKEDAGPTYRPARGRLKLKQAAESREQFKPPESRRPAKEVGEKLQVRSTGRGKSKPTEYQPAETRQEDGPPAESVEYSDQIARRTRRTPGASEATGRYVRFRVHVADGEMSVVDSQLVDGDLMLPPTVQGEFAYEITDGERLLHADTIPDLGVVRSFADPRGTLEQQRHHIYRQSTYDFDVRVPAEDLMRSALSAIDIVLYRVKEGAPTREISRSAPLGTQFEREIRELTRVSGIPDESLPEPLRRTPRSRRAT